MNVCTMIPAAAVVLSIAAAATAQTAPSPAVEARGAALAAPAAIAQPAAISISRMRLSVRTEQVRLQ